MGAGTAFAAAAGMQAVSGLAGAYTDYTNGRLEAKQYKLQSQQLEVQKGIIADQYRTKRDQLQGEAIATAGHAGVKVSGSVAHSISTSLTELGMEESYKKFNINMEQNNLRYKQRIANINAKNALIQGVSKTATQGLMNYATYQSMWGVEDMSGQSSGWNPAQSAPSRKPSMG